MGDQLWDSIRLLIQEPLSLLLATGVTAEESWTKIVDDRTSKYTGAQNCGKPAKVVLLEAPEGSLRQMKTSLRVACTTQPTSRPIRATRSCSQQEVVITQFQRPGRPLQASIRWTRRCPTTTKASISPTNYRRQEVFISNLKNSVKNREMTLNDPAILSKGNQPPQDAQTRGCTRRLSASPLDSRSEGFVTASSHAGHPSPAVIFRRCWRQKSNLS